MDDKCTMENLLLTTKGVCDLYLHGAIESSDKNVRQAFRMALNDSLTMQENIYQDMAAKGWYPPQQASPQKIQDIRQKFTPMS